MAELIPYPFAALIERMFSELESADSIFDLPSKSFFLGREGRDYSVPFHDKRAPTPLGPASGPQTQMAQNLVLSWLCGCRILELKTVQILDELEIPRPCIDMETIGYNVEWSQELKLEQSLHEYIKGAMLIEILKASGKLKMAPGFGEVIYDMSVGYDLKGIQTERVQDYIRGMKDASAVVEHYRKQIPDRFSQFRDLDFPTNLSNSLTLSTFHGCPPDEIERIIDFLLNEHSLNCIIKLNPTLLGEERVRELLQGVMGYEAVNVPSKAFQTDTSWDQAQGFVQRLGVTADQLGLGFGVKFSNTLIVENHRSFFPESEKEMYLSGPPLHVLATNLVDRFRDRFGDHYPISFSAGIDRKNFADAVAIGLTPITSCSDLLKAGGYSRATTYFRELDSRMDRLGVNTIPDYIIKAYGNAEQALSECGKNAEDSKIDSCRKALEEGTSLLEAAGEDLYGRWLSQAKLFNTQTYAENATLDQRYALVKNSKPPTKVGSMLELFDCLTCDKCIPVCPNDANFMLSIPPEQVPVKTLTFEDGSWSVEESGKLVLDKKHQIANFADFCNECGNCDIFCPEDGGPYVLKPRFFGSRESFREFSNHDGFFIERNNGGDTVLARFSQDEYESTLMNGEVQFSGPGFNIRFSADDPEKTVSGEAETSVDLTRYEIMEKIRWGILESGHVNYASVIARQ
ncbi:MAG: glutamate synthase [Deltaproteobacteria bacterium]|jgi:putative selenate reductase|nr:glutamate synthase [Pseudomonadota bacterium]